MHPQGLQGTSEEMEIGEYHLAHEHKGLDTQNADPPQMDIQESSNKKETLTRSIIAIDKTTDLHYDTEKAFVYSTYQTKTRRY